MGRPSRETYQTDEGLERAIVDLVRVGTTGFGPGVRQLAARLVRSVPAGVKDPDQFRVALNAAIASGASASVGLRFGSGEIPTSDDGNLELAEVNPFPAVRDFVVDDRVARHYAFAAAFAAHAGVAPIPASSGNTQRHRLARGGNRQLNRALFTIAMVQARWHPPAREFLARKRAEGKTAAEARRCLKRHLANVVYRALIADLQQPVQQKPAAAA